MTASLPFVADVLDVRTTFWMLEWAARYNVNLQNSSLEYCQTSSKELFRHGRMPFVERRGLILLVNARLSKRGALIFSVTASCPFTAARCVAPHVGPDKGMWPSRNCSLLLAVTCIFRQRKGPRGPCAANISLSAAKTPRCKKKKGIGFFKIPTMPASGKIMNTAMRCAGHIRCAAHMRSATVSQRPGVLSPQIFSTRSLSSPVVLGQPTSKSTVWVRSKQCVMVVNVLW